jgi:dipeptidyl aminopeptidase/acylaminoacyl peptidase
MDYDSSLALPRVTALALSTDGSRLVATISQYDEESGKQVPSLWELDPAGAGEPQRLTHSKEGESQPVFHHDGSLYFVSSRANEDKPALWRLPAVGEAEKVLARPGGVEAVRTGGGTVVVKTPVMPGAADAEADEKLRKDRKATGILHTTTPTRIWNQELGPDESRLQVVGGNDLTPEPGHALADMDFVVTPDGSTVVTMWAAPRPGWPQVQLVAIDTTTGVRRVLADDPSAGFRNAAVSHDGRYVAALRRQDPEPDVPPSGSLVLIDLTTGEQRDLVNDPDVWVCEPPELQFATDDSAVFFVVDDHGERPIMRVDVQSGELTRVTEDGGYQSLQAGDALYAIRSSVDSPPSPVRVDLSTGEVVHLMPKTTVGKLERVATTLADGTQVEGWLLLPDTSEPAPLVVNIHGGPHMAAGGWNWRWNNALFLDAGYALLQPDYSLSVGYGAAFIERGWEGWGATAYVDLMAIVDAVVQRPDIDGERTAAIGGSFGGYLVNWIAGHTDRFRCLVSHAGIWSFLGQNSESDYTGYFGGRQFGYPEERPERYAERSPVTYLANVVTPTLVIHGADDERVPYGQGLHLFNDLQRKGVESAFLSFPDEGHHVLQPANSRLWHHTVRDWLAKYL